MKRIKIDSVENEFFNDFWEIYEPSFPLCERRAREDHNRIFNIDYYHLDAWVKDDKVLGFIGWWDLDDVRYVEHYAIHPASRSEGYGSIFLKQWMDDSDKLVLLEIEPVEDEISQRRQNFYHRLGFIDSPIRHWHPPYHKGMDRVDLWLLTYPSPLEENAYQRFHEKQKEVIIPPFN
ncbi:MAG: GNAT family N-acetyltransferase [Bacteroidales bacterium]|nr:GNAT family N-acetyltransferase [Bacteroidales bacterium]